MKPSSSFLLIAAAILPSAVCSQLPRREFNLEPRNNIGATCKLSADPPADKICGKRGDIGPNFFVYPFADKQLLSLTKCRDWCFNQNDPRTGQGGCVSWSWDTQTKICNFHTDDITTSTFQASNTSTQLWYSTNCFTCTGKCAAPGSIGNLLDNGNFETSRNYLGPWGGGANFDSVTSPGHNSAHAFNGTGLDQVLSTCEGQDYFISVDTLAPQDSSIRVALGDANVNRGLAAGANWTTLKFSTVTDPSTSIMYMNFSNPTLMDNAVVKPIFSPASYKTAGPNLLRNGGFESGSLSPWTVNSDPSNQNVTSEVIKPGLGGRSKGGNYRYLFKGTSPNLGFRARGVDTELDIDLATATSSSKTYVFRFDYRRRYHSGDLFAEIAGHQWTKLNSPLNTVLTFSRLFTGSGGVDHIRLFFDAGSSSGTKKPFNMGVELDNVGVFELADQSM